ncbi:flagellin N-terminal helical domain-containing protein [Kushneria sp. AK178]
MIYRAKDDAAGLAISNRMGAQINGLNQANRNANDGISLAQTAEGAMGQVTDNLQRVRELTVQAANGTNTDSDLASIQEEIGQRMEEIDRLAGQTQFNGKNLLDGTETDIRIQVGANDGQTINLTMADMTSATLFAGGSGTTPDVTAADFDAGTALADIDAALQNVDSARSTLGAQQNRLQSVVEGNSTTSTNLSAAQSQIKDADYATEVSNMSKAQILQQAGTSVLAQANQTTQGVMSLLR